MNGQLPASGARPDVKKKVSSERQREASRRNSTCGHGPDDTTRTKYNATQHVLSAKGPTPLDDAIEYEENVRTLAERYPSSDPIERFMVQQSALEMVRMHRMDLLEAANVCILSRALKNSNDPTSEDPPSILISVTKDNAAPIFDIVDRYRTASVNRLLRYRRELERTPREEACHEASDTDIGQGDVTS